MRAGELNKRVVIQHAVTGSPEKNEFGELNTEWQDLATVWAAIEPVNGREFWAQQQVQSEITVRIRIRYRTDVLPEMRVTYAGRIYVIKFIIDPQEYHQELQLMCSQGVRDA